ncbi:peptidoglycan recognition protein family protein [Actinoplanes sp. CA-051413]|uniref:peptidoglycan recognition protein family protein n=1 Tax=Actinoplanes sp. CA-051413 TaxID=3239899 RepID=UPI003D976CD5
MAAVVGTAMAMSGAVTVLAAGGGAAARPEALTVPATEPTLQTIDLMPVTGSSVTGRSASAAGARAVAPRTTGRFSMVGVTWSDPHRKLDGVVEIRTRRAADGAWTGWQRLESDGASPAEPGSGDAEAARGSTDPLWVGESDGVQARIADAGRTRPLPAGLRMDLVNPGEPGTPAPRTTPAAYALPAPAGRARADVTVPPRPAPAVVSRARWGANEKIVQGAPEYSTDVQVVFVHHTAGTNNYSCAQSAAIVRSIQAYHVKSNHWDDIGYNFLVDKCGTLFEGRAGGVSRPVLGAHTLGFNARSSAIAVLGNYSGTGVPARVKRVIAQVAAYKIGAYGNTPTGRVAMTSSGSDRYAKGSTAMLNRVSGHRDTGKTECPGNTLYAQLGSIRSLAGAAPSGLTVTKVNGATKVGTTYYTRGTIRPFWQVSTATTMLYRFDVLVDDVVTASAPRGDRQRLLTLSSGRHTLRVRAVGLNGKTSITSVAVLVDRTLPEFTSGPSVSLRTGSVNGIVPVRVRWAVTDAGGLGSLALTAPAPVKLATTTTTWAGSVKPEADTAYGLRATDRAGNARSVAVQRTASVTAETAGERTGSWSTVTGTAYLGGQALRSTAAESSLSWTFTGRSAALAVSRTAVSGRVQVFVDDAPAGIIDLRSPETLHRRAVWTRAWPDSAQHTVRIVVEGTAGRPGVIADGLVYLR